MFRIQFRNPNTGRNEDHTVGTRSAAWQVATAAREAAPETHELRIRRQTEDGIWEIVTGQF